MKIREAIRAARKNARLTQCELAERVGVHEVTLRKWELGACSPNSSYIKNLCAALGCTETELLNGPQQGSFSVTLKFVKTLEGVSEEMNANGVALTISEDGYIGVSGGKKFETLDDVNAVVEAIRHKLTWGFEHKDEVAGREGK